MKKILAVTMLAAALTGGIILGVSSADADVITDTLKNMSKEDILGPEKPAPEANVPILDAQKVQEVLLDLREVEKNNGHLGIAHKRGLTYGQVKAIVKVRDARLMEIAEGSP